MQKLSQVVKVNYIFFEREEIKNFNSLEMEEKYHFFEHRNTSILNDSNFQLAENVNNSIFSLL